MHPAGVEGQNAQLGRITQQILGFWGDLEKFKYNYVAYS